MIDSSSVWVLLLLLTIVQTLPDDMNSNSIDSKMPLKLFEGDMILSTVQQQILSDAPKQNQQRNCLLDTKYRWPKKTVLYRLNGYKPEHVKLIKKAISVISNKTCLKFKEAAVKEKSYVAINNNNKTGCSSYVGYQGNLQTCNLNEENCMFLGIIMHELLHTVGFFHQHSNTNRDSYLRLHLENVLDGQEHNFIKYPNDTVNDYGLPYDYDSIMHYDSKAFSKNDKDTMTPIDPKVTLLSADSKTELSKIDIQKIKRMYECGGK